MIAKIHRGSNPVGLMFYLLGPGKTSPHVDARLIGSWDGLVDYHQSLKPAALGRVLNEPLGAGPAGRRRHVWSASLRNAEADRVLSDAEWLAVARDLVEETGLAPTRWFVVRHADDHVHVAASLVDERNGTPIDLSFDYPAARRVCVRHEDRLGLVRTGRQGKGSASYSPAEHRRSRPGERMAREKLRTVLRAAVAVATSSTDFVDLLASSGVKVELRYSKTNPDEVTGYKVAWLADDAYGPDVPVWYSPSKLAAELSWPKVSARWVQRPRSRGGVGRPPAFRARRPQGPRRGFR